MIVTAVVIAGFGAAITWASISNGVGTLASAGPGMWPAIVGVALVALGLYLLVFESAMAPEPLTSQSWRVLAAFVLTGVYILALNSIGPSVPTFLMLLIWLRWLSSNSWRSSLLISLLSAAALYWIFVVALSISFPDDLVFDQF